VAVVMKTVVAAVISCVLLSIVQAQSDGVASSSRPQEKAAQTVSSSEKTSTQKEYVTQSISVLGEVQKPGIYPFSGPRRLFDVLSVAGGITSKAGQEVTITHRDHPNDVRTVLLSNDPAKSAEANVEVFPGDTVVVSKAGIVYVVGDVHKPSGLVIEHGTQMTVLKAIAMAEGTNPTAALNGAKLIRKTPAGPQEIPLELKKILASKSPDVELQAEDIIFVPSSAALLDDSVECVDKGAFPAAPQPRNGEPRVLESYKCPSFARTARD
jgi:protein involved in polysaccharide export with SLBB domain